MLSALSSILPNNTEVTIEVPLKGKIQENVLPKQYNQETETATTSAFINNTYNNYDIPEVDITDSSSQDLTNVYDNIISQAIEQNTDTTNAPTITDDIINTSLLNSKHSPINNTNNNTEKIFNDKSNEHAKIKSNIFINNNNDNNNNYSYTSNDTHNNTDNQNNNNHQIFFNDEE